MLKKYRKVLLQHPAPGSGIKLPEPLAGMSIARFILSALILLKTGVTGFPQEYVPRAEISNGIIRAELYLPDSERGYYRSTRFDWAGVIPQLEYMGHTFYGKWFDKYDPEIHDAIMGPVEEFGQIGYDQAEPGGKFLKIGVGVLQRPNDNPYNSFRLYDINNPGEWKIKKKAREVQFMHILKDTDYSYKYIKTVKLIKGSPEMHLEHTLTNTGNKTIETTVYNHNFLIIDKELTGPNYKITFPFELSGKGQGIGEIAIFKGNQIRFLREMSESERIFCGSITGLSGTLSDYNFTVENLKTGAGVRISCDRPLTRLVFWCSPVTLSPEPYINIKIEPGESFRWIVFNQYYMSDVQGME